MQELKNRLGSVADFVEGLSPEVKAKIQGKDFNDNELQTLYEQVDSEYDRVTQRLQSLGLGKNRKRIDVKGI